jgi:diacylglycerol kinase
LKGSLRRSLWRAILGFKVGALEKNFWRHVISSAGAITCAIYYGLPPIELAFVIFCCGCVIGAELLNTGIERIADEHSNPRSSLDVSATGVLVISIFALACGAILIVPRAWNDPLLLICVIFAILTGWMVIP